MRLITTTTRGMSVDEEYKEELESLLKILNLKSLARYTKITVTLEEYLNHYTILDVIDNIREVDEDG